MRLGFYHHATIVPKDKRLYIIGHIGRFLDGLAQNCTSLTLFMHVANEDDPEDNIHEYALIGENINFVSMGPHRSAPYRTISGEKYRRIVKKYINQIDALLIRGPSPLLPVLAKLGNSIPIALLIGGDYLAEVDTLPQPFWRKELIRIWSRYYQNESLKAAKRSLTFVNSRKLFEEMQPYVPKLFEIKTTTLTEKDFYVREDTCKASPFHLLYTGRMARTKGILDMVEALALLIRQGQDVVLDLVGPEEKGDPILDQVNSHVKELNISERVIYHGFRPVGPELFNFYKQADIYLLASQSSFEGFPRTIWEAMAHSLPVIATSVGSIPYYLRNNLDAIIVPPNDPLAITAAVDNMLSDSILRKTLLSNGYALAHENQVNKRSQEMIQIIQEWLRSS